MKALHILFTSVGVDVGADTASLTCRWWSRWRWSDQRITSEARPLLVTELEYNVECCHESASYPFHICWSWCRRWHPLPHQAGVIKVTMKRSKITSEAAVFLYVRFNFNAECCHESTWYLFQICWSWSFAVTHNDQGDHEVRKNHLGGRLIFSAPS